MYEVNWRRANWHARIILSGKLWWLWELGEERRWIYQRRYKKDEKFWVEPGIAWSYWKAVEMRYRDWSIVLLAFMSEGQQSPLEPKTGQDESRGREVLIAQVCEKEVGAAWLWDLLHLPAWLWRASFQILADRQKQILLLFDTVLIGTEFLWGEDRNWGGHTLNKLYSLGKWRRNQVDRKNKWEISVFMEVLLPRWAHWKITLQSFPLHKRNSSPFQNKNIPYLKNLLRERLSCMMPGTCITKHISPFQGRGSSWLVDKKPIRLRKGLFFCDSWAPPAGLQCSALEKATSCTPKSILVKAKQKSKEWRRMVVLVQACVT